jgi:uncharacterized membrane protein
MTEQGQKPSSERSEEKASRLFAVDALRGLIIVFMALDHANHFIAQTHSPGEYFGGAFPVFFDPLAFLTRFVAQLCAPGFFFLMGAGMVLFANSRRERGWGEWRLVRHFWIRGLVLIALQLLIVNRAWELSPGGWGVDWYVGVLSALGGGLILGSLLLQLKPSLLVALTLVLMVGAELLTPGPDQWGPFFSQPMNVLLVPGGQGGLWVTYPVLQWLELVTFGLAFGHWLSDDPRRAFGRALKLGVAFLLAFAVLRQVDGFGNLRPRMGDTWMDVLTVVKYPPSMTFILLTMGVNLTLLWVFYRAEERARPFLQPLQVFGQAPLCFYVLHLFLYAGLYLLLTPEGTSLLLMYPVWLLGLLLLFPVSLWYGRFKRRQPAGSLLRFF